MFNLEALSPEEKDKLLNELLSKYEGEGVSPEAGHADIQEDLQTMEPIVKVIEILINKVEELEERLTYTEKLVIDDLFGGIEKLYKKNIKAKGVEELKSKYAEHFSPFESTLKELAPDEDWGEALYDMLDSLKGNEGYNDEMGHNAIMEAHKALADKLSKIKGETAPVGDVSEEIKPEGDGVAIEKTEVKAIPVEAEDEFLQKVRSMKAKSKKSLI